MENRMHGVRSENSHQGVAMEGVKYASEMAYTNRRVLGDIKNIIQGPRHPMAMSKRGLSRKTATAVNPKNNAGFGGHRPVTRKFAATLANQPTSDSNLGAPEFQYATNLAPLLYPFADLLAQNFPFSQLAPFGSERQKRNADTAFNTPTDMESNKMSDDIPLPMLSEKDEVMSSDFKEIEMEDIEEAAPDIDSGDAGNSLAVTEYVDEIYCFYRKTEGLSCVSPNYMSSQTDINEKMRGILIDWLIEVHYKLELLEETLFLTVNIVDRFLACENVVRKKLQLVGVTAMLLACKYEEVSVPIVEDLILICDRAYTRADILEMERMIVNTLKFNMSVPTPYCFMRRFLKAAHSDKKLELLSFFLIELSLVEYEMLKFTPSMLAASAIYTAQCTMNGFKSWNKCCELHTKYSELQLMECSRMMVELHQRAPQGKLTGVHRKYSTYRYGCAAKSEPATFLLDTRV